MRLKIQKYNKLLFVIASCVIIALVCSYRVFEKPGLWFGDEVGYFSSAAYYCGFDWSTVASELGYFGLGYGFFLIPGFLFCQSYHAMMCYTVVLNIVMVVISFLLCLRVVNKLNNGKNFYLILVASLVATLYVNNTVQVQMGWSESLNLLIYWCCINCFMDVIETNKIRSYILYGFFLSFSVIIHMRNVSIAGLGAALLGYWLIKEKKIKIKNLVVFASTVFVMVVVFFVSKKLMQNLLWRANEKDAIVNDVSSYSDNASNIAKYITVRFVLESIFTKIFYVISTTYGLVVIGSAYVLTKKRNPVTIFALSVFIVNLLWTSYNMVIPMRYDVIYYGRYFEPNIGLLVALGFIALFDKTLTKKWVISNFSLFLILYRVSFYFAESSNKKIIESGYTSGAIFPCMSGFSKFLFENGQSNIPKVAFINSLMVLALLVIVTIAGYCILSFNNNKFGEIKTAFITLIAALVLIINWISVSQYTVNKIINFTSGSYAAPAVLTDIMGSSWQDSNTQVYFYNKDKNVLDVMYMQLYIGKSKIITIDKLSDTDCGYVLVSHNSENYEDEIEEIDEVAEWVAHTGEFELYEISEN